jgi:hypothetical protein
MEFLDFTSVTRDEFPQLVPSFKAAFHAYMAAWCLDGKPRTARRFAVDEHCRSSAHVLASPASDPNPQSF